MTGECSSLSPVIRFEHIAKQKRASRGQTRCNIYVRSERAGKRVMASLRRFIEGRLRLKVNEAKSAVARPEERHFVGFCLRREPEDGRVEVRLSVRSKERIDARIRDLTPRNWGQPVRQCIERIDSYLGGWIEYFRVCTESSVRTLRALSAHLRRRLRAIILRQWKRKRTIARRLIKLGVRPRTAWRDVYAGRRGLWALSHCPAVDRGLNKGLSGFRNGIYTDRESSVSH